MREQPSALRPNDAKRVDGETDRVDGQKDNFEKPLTRIPVHVHFFS